MSKAQTVFEALKLAQATLEAIATHCDLACVVTPDGAFYLQPAIAALREALAEQPAQQEPVVKPYAYEYERSIVEAEREACAKVCDDLALPPDVARSDASIWEVATLDCANAIRNRGNT